MQTHVYASAEVSSSEINELRARAQAHRLADILGVHVEGDIAAAEAVWVYADIARERFGDADAVSTKVLAGGRALGSGGRRR